MNWQAISGTVPTPVEPPSGAVYELSGWWRRVGAASLDGLIVAATALPVDVTIDLLFDGDIIIKGPEAGFAWAWQGVGALVSMVAFILLVVLVMGMNNGQTFGKMAANIRVVREDGKPVDLGFAFKREFFVKYLLFQLVGTITLSLVTLLDDLWPLWDDENRALHDRMAHTRVVRTDITPQLMPVSPHGWPPPFGYPPPPGQSPPQQPYQLPPYPAPPFPVAPPPAPPAPDGPVPPDGR